jgi:hypothetical protein
VGLARQRQQRDSLIHIVVAGILMPGQIALAAVKLLAPLHGHAPIEIIGNGAVQLVDIDRFETLPQPVTLGTQTRHRFVMVMPFDIEAVFECLNDKVVNLLVEAQLRQQPAELLFEHFFPHEFLRAFSPEAGAMIVDVFALLDLGRHGAAAMPAAYQAGEGELTDAASGLGMARLVVAAVKDVLNGGP